MLLYAHTITARLEYIIDFIGNEILAEIITLTTDKEKFRQYTREKINYSNQPITNEEFRIEPVGLLFENTIEDQHLQCFEYYFLKAFYKTEGDFPFDVFAATFYLISRYEEYLPHKKDMYGRFAHEESIAFKQGFLSQPMVNTWLLELRKALKNQFPSLMFRHRSFKFIPTYDIDIAWSYRNKGFLRNAGGFFKSIQSRKWQEANDRIEVLQEKKKDPFDCYEWLDALHLYCRLRPYYFFLLAEKTKGYDKNISPRKKALQQLIAYQSSKGTVGIHPSWQSGDDQKLLKQEIGWMEFIIDQPIYYSRQHYIRLTLPETYRRLMSLGITKDFSMGYGSINGFRASVASSFYWFDLEKNEKTSLLLYPFCFMDANSFYEQQLTPREAFEELMHYYNSVKKVQGMMVTIWHNNFLGTDPQYKGWREVYEIFLKEEVYWDR